MRSRRPRRRSLPKDRAAAAPPRGLLQLGDERLGLRLDRRELGAQRRHSLGELCRLRHRLLCGADRERRLARTAGCDRLRRRLDRSIREVGSLAGLCGVVRDHRERRRSVGGRECGEGWSGRGEDRVERRALTTDPLELLRGVLLQFAELVECGGVVIQDVVDLVRDLDDANMPRPAVVDRVLDLVVELLLQVEGLGDLGLRRIDDARELLGRALAELGDGEAEFLPARGDRIVRLHERESGLCLDLLVGQSGEWIGGIGDLGHGAALTDLGAAARAAHESDDEPHQQRDHDDRDDDQADPERAGAPSPWISSAARVIAPTQSPPDAKGTILSSMLSSCPKLTGPSGAAEM